MIRKRGGFTLVELLVVVAIIIILAAILFPVFAKARDKAQATRCLNNLKQMSVAVQMYEDDYAGAVLPYGMLPGGAYGTNEGSWALGSFWQDLIDPYLKQIKRGRMGGQSRGQGEIFSCPSAPTETAESGVSWQTGKQYGYNFYLTKSTSASQVRYPSLTLRITETASYDADIHNPAVRATYKGGSFLAPRPSTATSGLMLQSPGWHNGYSHVLWFDGHVSSVTWQRVMYTDNASANIDVWCRLEPKDGYTPEG